MAKRWTLERTVAPTIEPVTLDEIRDHLRLSDSADEATALAYLLVAREAIEQQELSRALLTQTWKLRLEGWPWDSPYRRIRLPRPLLQSVTSITYTDTSGTTQTLSASLYTVNAQAEPAIVVPAYGQSWPSPRVQRGVAAVTIEYVAGWTNRGLVPEAIRQAIKLLVGEMWENREGVIIETFIPKVLPTFAYLLTSQRCNYDFGEECG